MLTNISHLFFLVNPPVQVNIQSNMKFTQEIKESNKN